MQKSIYIYLPIHNPNPTWYPVIRKEHDRYYSNNNDYKELIIDNEFTSLDISHANNYNRGKATIALEDPRTKIKFEMYAEVFIDEILKNNLYQRSLKGKYKLIKNSAGWKLQPINDIVAQPTTSKLKKLLPGHYYENKQISFLYLGQKANLHYYTNENTKIDEKILKKDWDFKVLTLNNLLKSKSKVEFQKNNFQNTSFPFSATSL